MTEYEARGFKIRTDADGLTLLPTRGSAASRELGTRRIPFGAIREVLYRGSNLSDSVIALVLGDSPAPEKTSAWSAGINDDAFLFKPGKQAKGAKALHQLLASAVETARSAGIDPRSVPYDPPPSGEDVLRAMNHRKLDKDALRDDVAAAAFHLMDVPKPVRTLLTMLPDAMIEGESVQALTSGTSGSLIAGQPALMVLTDRRVFVLQQGATVVTDELGRGDIATARWEQGIVGKLEVGGAGRSITIRALDIGATGSLVEALRTTNTSQDVSTAEPDVIDRLERLASLLGSGALTQAEFDEQKAKLLKSPS